MKNDDTMHRSKCAATYRVQLMLNLSGDNTLSLYYIGNRTFVEIFYRVLINLLIAVI